MTPCRAKGCKRRTRDKKVRNARPRCVECGRFIGLGEMADGSACFRLTPDHAFGPEVVEWTCRQCAIGRLLTMNTVDGGEDLNGTG